MTTTLSTPLPRQSQVVTPVRLALDFLFCLAVPVVLLRAQLPGLDFGFSQLVGAFPAYLTASLVPVTYVLLAALHARAVNTVSLLAAGSALLNGALAFVPVSGLAFAVRDSSGSLFLLSVAVASLLLRRPLAAALLRVALLPDTPRRVARLDALLTTRVMRRAVRWATLVLALKALTVAGVNVAVKYQLVTASFGTPEFNAQLAHASALMIPLAWLASGVSYPLSTSILLAGLRRAVGSRGLPWGPPLWAALETTEAR